MKDLHFLRAPIAAAALVLSGAAFAADVVNVELDRALIIRVPKGTQTLIIGNPLVADVTLLSKAGSVIVTARSFGTTNMIALDGEGAPLAESTIKVAANNNRVLVMRGTEQQSFACNPRCAPTVALDDNPQFMKDTIGSVTARNGASQTGGR